MQLLPIRCTGHLESHIDRTTDEHMRQSCALPKTLLSWALKSWLVDNKRLLNAITKLSYHIIAFQAVVDLMCCSRLREERAPRASEACQDSVSSQTPNPQERLDGSRMY